MAFVDSNPFNAIYCQENDITRVSSLWAFRNVSTSAAEITGAASAVLSVVLDPTLSLSMAVLGTD